MNCPVGQVEYKGMCLPSYLTPAEKEQAYQEAQAASKKAKKVTTIIAIGFAIAGAIAIYLTFFS